MTPNPLDGPFMSAVQMTDYSNTKGYAIPSDPTETTPSRARQLREAAIGRSARGPARARATPLRRPDLTERDAMAARMARAERADYTEG